MNEEAPARIDASPARAFFAAVQFLTRVPVPGGGMDIAPFAADLRRGLVFFPLVGAGIGAVTAAALWGFSFALPFAIAIIAALALEAVLTGAFHEDAVADFCDAFGGGWTREDVLRILKDSRVGSFGVTGLVFAIALRALSLISLGNVWAAAVALVVSGAVGRLLIVALMAWVPPVEAREGLSKSVGEDADALTVLQSVLWVSPVLVLGAWFDWRGLAIAAIVLAIFAVWFRRFLMARIGGVTGDCLGFAAYVGIIVTTLAFARVA